ncbi:sensor histidine kinase/response regulator [Phenylobacterium zucineum HLK1]|uniref:histidine kinase n=1 Tax=Phenylobacterium zucineum (strain HLK1) TaxID=450851 RepID=B4RFJ9_PHEZH|nr:ATP-binding protein [Phenylobacterium zucineum]ACG77080.1 sensor histidine kinase/response regulator [Phenylobacterium zucineum HLK1]
MALLLDIAPCVPPVFSTATGGELYRRFESEPDTLAIAVVDAAGRPIGIVERNSFLVRMAAQYGHALWSRRPIAGWMKTDPLVADGDVTVSEFCGRILEERPSELLHGFIVTCGGRYAGVGTMLALLQASAAETASHAGEMTRLAEAARASSAQAHEALAAKARFLAVMSHEIRTPLNGVLGVAEILRRKLPDAELAPLVNTIIESGGVLLRLLNDALDLSRAEAAGLELDEAPLPVAELLDDVLALWTPQADIRGVPLTGAYDGPQDLWVLGDRVRLRQILNNLVGNGLKFTGAGGVHVRLTARTEGDCVRLAGAVSDSGPGVPPERLETIFQPFQQTEEGVRRGGAGLGLAVCRQIVQRMDGTIQARNRPEGGAEFAFETPLFRVPAPSSVGGATAEPPPGVEGRVHVLIADDNATNRLVAASLCETFGCTSECVEDGAAAVEAAASGRFDLILMDIKMPVMDGAEATRRIRSGAGAGSRTPILALTANADPADAAFYRRCGVNGVVEKPIRPDRLLAAMTAVLNLVAAESDAVTAC